MVIKTEDKTYPDILTYLEYKERDFYRKFMKHYQGTRAIPGKENLTPHQYLLWVVQHMKPKARIRLQALDDSLISREEIEELEKIINSSPELKRIARKHAEIQNPNVSRYLPKKDKQKLEKAVANDLYDHMNSKDKEQYTGERISVIMHKLNIGPWKHGGGCGLGDNGVESFISRNRDIFEGHEDLAIKILEGIVEELNKVNTVLGAYQS